MDEEAINTMMSFSNFEGHVPVHVQHTNSPQSTKAPTGSNQPSNSASTSTKTIPSSKPITVWTDEMNVMLCREVELLNPFQHRDRTKERGKVWEQVAQNLCKHGLAVNKRSVRDRFNLIKTQINKKNREELQASGIAPELTPVEDEISSIVEDILEKEQETKEMHNEVLQKEEMKTKDGVEMRKRALETFSETTKRIKGEKEAGSSRKRRNTGSDAHEFLLQKLGLEKEAREQDYKFRREEAERKRLDDERRFEREERQEERRREREEREEERRIERERREEERRRQEEETKRRDQQAKERQMEFFQQQLMQQNQMIMLMLEKQNKE